ncbi:T9SS type A sorting domain-containing protein [Nonlabens sp. YIK11]|uniref:T9SS type A sorting domain-containing protein n=1 Tax=Nonlabens sp. YIK11 TaxID=1453349 RepID=UPI000AFF2E92|nr:T9SS type A sorting domain-containing protein [Nonlabens sp. YIK11]
MKTLYFFVALLLGNLTQLQSQSFILQQKLIQPDPFAGDNYGNSIDVTGDLMIIGDPSDYNDLAGSFTTFTSGAAYIYRRDTDGIWNFEQKLVFPNRPRQVDYGYEVEIDGDYAFVSAIFGDFSTSEEQLLDPGNLFIYKFNDQTTTWDLWQSLEAPVRETRAYYGMDFSYQNGTLIVGESWQTRDPNNPGAAVNAAGVVHVYNLNSGSGKFELVQSLVAPDRSPQAAFGYSVDFDGDKLIIGAARERHEINGQAINLGGSSYYYQKDASGIFNFVQKIVPDNVASGDFYGLTTTISADLMAVSAPFKNITNSSGTWFKQGLVYLYKYDTVTNSWSEIEQITTTSLGGNMWYGHDMDLEGNRLVVSSYQDRFMGPSGFLTPAGAFWLHELSTDGTVVNSSQVSALDQNPSSFVSEFGYSCAISGNIVVVGAPDNEYDLNDDFTNEESGAAFVYKLDQTAGSRESVTPAISIYPNPAKSTLNVNAETDFFSYSIQDLTGKEVLQGKNHRSMEAIPLDDLASGLYFINVEFLDYKEVIKFIKIQ